MITMTYHFIPVRMFIVKTARNKFWWGCRESGTPVPCWWECKLVQLLWKTVGSFLKKLEVELPHDPAIPLVRIYPKVNTNSKNKRKRDAPPCLFTAALFTTVNTEQQPKYPQMGERVKKIYKDKIEYFFSHKRRESCHLWQLGWTLMTLC